MEFLKELGLYDILARLLPGTIVVWAAFAVVDGLAAKRAWARLSKNLPQIIIVAYVVGSFLLVFSSSGLNSSLGWGRGPIAQRAFNGLGHISEKLLAKADKAFETKLDPSNSESGDAGKLVSLCQRYCQVHEIDEFLNTMEVRNAFFESLCISLSLVALLFLARSIWDAALLFRGKGICDARAKTRFVQQFLIVAVAFCGAAAALREAPRYDYYLCKYSMETFYVHVTTKNVHETKTK